MQRQELADQAVEVLHHNDVGDFTRPAPNVYPHQWLWDSCFAAMGWAHIDIQRAQREILSLFRGQWHNGMMPHMIFAHDANGGRHMPQIWDSRLSPFAPTDVSTSGITQPPMIAEATHYIGSKLSPDKRQEFYRRVYPGLLQYHRWLYEQRDPHHDGLVLLIHPWETGMDNTPPWMEALHLHSQPKWIKFLGAIGADKLIDRLRTDTRQIPPEERASTLESLMLYHVTRRLRRKKYDTTAELSRSHFLIEDVFFNSILIRANTRLKAIAETIGATIPRTLLSNMNRATKALENLWDEVDGQYYSRYFINQQFIKEPSIAALAPLYSGVISKARAGQIVELINRHDMFSSNFPLPSVPLSSTFFSHRRYWQGPVWINTNWLIYDGLKRYGFDAEAEKIRQSSLNLVGRSSFHEYFSPIDGYGAGVEPFSWSAALTLVLIHADD